MKRLIVGLLLLLVFVPALARDRGYPPGDTSLSGRLIELSVVDSHTGWPLPIYSAQGLEFIEGVPGREYSIRLVNRTHERVLVVLAVDGINVISGDTAAYNQTGYVLNPYATVEIDGWRKSFQSVAKFEFTRPEASYAGRTDRLWQVGVIGAAVFREDRPRRVYRPAPRPVPEMAKSGSGVADGAPAPSARAAQAEASRSVGTGYGQEEWSPATSTAFSRRSSTPDEVLRLDYDDRSGLYHRGVRDFRWLPGQRYHDHRPAAFPEGFAPPPPRR